MSDSADYNIVVIHTLRQISGYLLDSDNTASLGGPEDILVANAVPIRVCFTLICGA